MQRAAGSARAPEVGDDRRVPPVGETQEEEAEEWAGWANWASKRKAACLIRRWAEGDLGQK
jgi:hypothetical protein